MSFHYCPECDRFTDSPITVTEPNRGLFRLDDCGHEVSLTQQARTGQVIRSINELELDTWYRIEQTPQETRVYRLDGR